MDTDQEWTKYKSKEECPNPYWKYRLDINGSFIATIKTPTMKYLEEIINLLHYGKSVQLKQICLYRDTKGGISQRKGQYWLTKYGRIKVRF